MAETNCDAKYRAMDIANFYIRLANDLDDNVDNLKLNKLLFYSQAWSLVRLGRPLFEDKIQAWEYGPVVSDVYHAYKTCGKTPIQEPLYETDEKIFSSDELELLIDIYNNYGKYTSIALKNMTHVAGSPWDRVYVPQQNNEITLKAMGDYFKDSEEMPSYHFNFSPEYVTEGITDDEI